MSLTLIAGARWADRYNLSSADRSRLIVTMLALDSVVGTGPALLVGQRRARSLEPPPPAPDVDRPERNATGRERSGRPPKKASKKASDG